MKIAAVSHWDVLVFCVGSSFCVKLKLRLTLNFIRHYSELFFAKKIGKL